jgi:hemoglobin
MKKMLCRLFVVGLLCTSALPSLAAPAPQAASTPSSAPSLYKRLGGYDAIAAVTDDFLARLLKDQHVVDFLCNATGGPCAYTGQDMKTAHTGLHITEAEWNAGAQDLVQTLDKFKVPDQEKTEVLNAVTALKGDIVGR